MGDVVRSPRPPSLARRRSLLATGSVVAVMFLALVAGPAGAQPPPGSAHDQLGKIVQELVDGKIDLDECGRRVDPLLEELNHTVPGADWENGQYACGQVVLGWLEEGRISERECEQAFQGAEILGPNHPCEVDPRRPFDSARPEVLKPFRFDSEWARWLTDTSPDSSHPHELAASAGGFGGEGSRLQSAIQAAALALLSIILTFSVVHYWASGFVNAGGFEPATAAMRVGGAGLFILAWPELVAAAGSLQTSVSRWVMGDGGENAEGALDVLDGLGPSTGPAFNEFLPEGLDLISSLFAIDQLFAFLFGLAIALVMLALSVAKLMLTFGLTLLYLGMPLLIALWPVPGLNWAPVPALRAAGAIGLVPVSWAVCLVAFSQVGGQIWPEGKGDDPPPGAFLPAFADPLLGIMLLLFLFAVMRQVLRWGGIVPQGSRPLGAAWGAVMGLGYMGFRAVSGGFRTASNAARRHEQRQRWTQQDARTARGDIRRELADATAGTRQEVGSLQKHSEHLVRTAEAKEFRRQNHHGHPGTARNGSPGGAVVLGHDDIPTRPANSDLHGQSRLDARELQGRGFDSGRMGPENVRGALETLERSGPMQGPRGAVDPAEAAARHLHAGHAEGHSLGRFSDAHLASGLTDEQRAAYLTLAAAPADVRQQGLSLWESGHSSSAPSEQTPAAAAPPNPDLGAPSAGGRTPDPAEGP
jgi:hypothetical protein